MCITFSKDDKLGLAVFTINQLALDFDGNCERIIESIRIALEKGSGFRIGPELEVCGYSCEDSFYEEDTVHHSWETVAKIINENFRDIIIDLGEERWNNKNYYEKPKLTKFTKLFLFSRFLLKRNANLQRWRSIQLSSITVKQ